MTKSKTKVEKPEIALEVKNVSKSFRLPTEQSSGIKQAFINRAKGIKGYKEHHVLNDISFKVEKGDFFGIVGRNGSGKSTLLKIISQIYQPDSGEIKVNGTLVPFIELGVGFNPELSGRENVYLNGALLGFSHEEVSSMYDEIVDFAELEEFMDQKLKNYSSGMQVRLAFSIAIKAQGDILVLDEVLAVGDEAFQRKCNDFFSEIKKDKSKTIILVTHSMGNVRKYCNKAVMIEDGEIIISGSPNDVANEYTQKNFSTKTDNAEIIDEDFVNYKTILKTENVLSSRDKLIFDIEYENKTDRNIYDVVIEIDDISRSNTPILLDRATKLNQKRGKYCIRYEYDISLINDGEYNIISTLRNKKNEILSYTSANNSAKFLIRNEDKTSKWPLLRARGRVVYVEEK